MVPLNAAGSRPFQFARGLPPVQAAHLYSSSWTKPPIRGLGGLNGTRSVGAGAGGAVGGMVPWVEESSALGSADGSLVVSSSLSERNWISSSMGSKVKLPRERGESSSRGEDDSLQGRGRPEGRFRRREGSNG